MDYLSLIKRPIESEFTDFVALFNESLEHSDGLLQQALNHIRQRAGKRMRPMLTLLMAGNYGRVTAVTQHAAVGLELLHTASLVHDDVVDESSERRGQSSVNAVYDNKVAVLVGDYLLSTALLHVAKTGNTQIVEYLARLGRTLASGEILQLSNISNTAISEDVYYEVIKQKTAALFEACCTIGALSTGATPQQVAEAGKFGQNLGIIFQIRDDIFDYYNDGAIGKPTGNDMTEGKITLPLIHALNTTRDPEMLSLAHKVKELSATRQDIGRLTAFAISNGGIEYARQRMDFFHAQARVFLDSGVGQGDIRDSLSAYLDYVSRRDI